MSNNLWSELSDTRDSIYISFSYDFIWILGWLECVGCADRSAYDLTQHSKYSGVRLVAEKVLPEPKLIDVLEVQVDKNSAGKKSKKDIKLISEYISRMSNSELELLVKRLTTETSEYE